MSEVLTFGCRLNAYESEVIRGHLGAGDTIVVNTCAVTREAERQARQAIRKARREHPEATIVATGCAVQIDPAAWAAMTEIDRLVGNAEKLKAETWSAPGEERVQVNDIMAVEETAGHLIAGFEEKVRAFVQIQNGCDHRCTFCIIPYGRGPSRSVAAGDIVAEIRALVAAGTREVVLTGVDITSWGADLPGRPKLGDLVRRILKLVPELPRLRITSLDVAEVDESLYRAIAEEERLMPHLHLSLQAGDAMVLKRMKRRHTPEQAVTFCEQVRRLRPDTVFGADLIAGFPTETEAMFGNTLAHVADCGLTWLHVFPYSERPGTPAARMPQVDKAARDRRRGGGSVPRGPRRAHRKRAGRKCGGRAHGAVCGGDAGAAGRDRGAVRGDHRERRRRPAAGGVMAEGGWFSRLKSGLSRSSGRLTESIGAIFTRRKLDQQALEELEEALIAADIGVTTAAKLTAELAKKRFGKDVAPEEVKGDLADSVTAILEPLARPLAIDPGHRPHVVLVMGVNGTGKTTTIGKLAKLYNEQGLKVVLAAGDTFRAAAIEQLQIWGERTGCTVVAGKQGADAAGLAYGALERARAEGADLLLIDTAGRLHNKDNLMAELSKIVRVIGKLDPSAPHDRLLVLDATTGQNAHAQVEVFRQIGGVTGLVVTKLDGSAKGGVIVGLADRFGLPIHAIGVGEGADDLRPFSARDFARSLMGLG